MIGASAPHLVPFTIILLLLLFGYEIFNFSLSMDEELYGSGYEIDWSLLAISQGRWGMGLVARLFPRLGDIPMMATVIFCAGLGVGGCVLARLLFRKHSAQYAFAGLFVSSPLWPHLAEFNITSWLIGIGCVLVTVAVLLFISSTREGSILATLLLILATGIYESFYLWFLAVICIRHVSVILGTAPEAPTAERPKFPWVRAAIVAVCGLLGYLALRQLLLSAYDLKLTYVQGFVRIAEFTTIPSVAISRTLERAWGLLGGSDPLFMGYGYVLMLLPLLGLAIVAGRLLWRGPLRTVDRLLAGALLVAAVLVALTLLVVSAGTVPSRALTSWIPICAFLGGVAFAFSGRFEKWLYVPLAAALIISMWISVALFYTDHLARKRDEVLAARIMARVDNVVTNPGAGPIPFVIVGAAPAQAAGPFRKLEIFGDSYFDSTHEGGNPWRIAAYLRILGIDTLEPHALTEANAFRPAIEAMPVWPAPGSVAMVDKFVVIKLGSLPPL